MATLSSIEGLLKEVRELLAIFVARAVEPPNLAARPLRNSQSAIQIISAKVFSVLRKYQMPRKRNRAITAIDAAKPGI